MKLSISLKTGFIYGLYFNLIIHFALLCFGIYAFDDNTAGKMLGVFLFLLMLGLFNNLVFGKNIKYYYQVKYLQISMCVLLMLMYFAGAASLILLSEDVTKAWVLTGTLISLLFIVRNLLNEPVKWDLARQKGKLRKYLDEQDWTCKFEMPHEVEDFFLDSEGVHRKKRMFSRLEKLHYVMPAIGMALSRNYPDQRVALSTVIFLFMGLIFASQIKIPLYKKFREWEKEKGKPLLLHDSWTNTTVNLKKIKG